MERKIKSFTLARMLRKSAIGPTKRAESITGPNRGVLMRTSFVLATVVSLALIGVATPAHAQRGGGARSRGGQVARGTVRTSRAVPRTAISGRQGVIAPRIVTSP